MAKWNETKPHAVYLDKLNRTKPVQLHVYDILPKYQHMDSDWNCDSDNDQVKLKKHKFICFFYHFGFPVWYFVHIQICCMPCPLL